MELKTITSEQLGLKSPEAKYQGQTLKEAINSTKDTQTQTQKGKPVPQASESKYNPEEGLHEIAPDEMDTPDHNRYEGANVNLQMELDQMDTEIQNFNYQQQTVSPEMTLSRQQSAQAAAMYYPTQSLTVKTSVEDYVAPFVPETGQPGLSEEVSGTSPTSITWDETQSWDVLGKGRYNPLTKIHGTIAKRNNNPGAMKLEFAGAKLGSTVSSSKMRSRGTAIAKAKKLYDGVVTLDRAGFIIFDSVESGRAAQIKLQVRRFKGDNLLGMLKKYAKNDGSGKAHHGAYEKAIISYAKKKYNTVIDPKKKIGSYSKDEMKALTYAQAYVESGGTV